MHRQTLFAVALASLALAAGHAQERNSASAAAWRARGLESGYNLDRAESMAAFRRAIEADPDAAAGYRLLAASVWTELVFQQGAITAEDFLGEAHDPSHRTPPDPALASVFHDSLEKAIALSERTLREHPDDPSAHFQVGAAYGFKATYAATIAGSLLGSLGPARRAFREHERVLALDPSRKDAGLIVGLYRYAVSELSGPLRLGAYLAGFGGGHDLGLRLVEEAAAFPSDVQPNAEFTLIVIYNRERRYDDALRVIHQLERQFPRNRLLWLEEGGTALRAGRPAEARAAIETGLARLAADPRPRAAGENARWGYTYGAVLLAEGETAAARSRLATALDGATRDWLRGRIHQALGTAADLDGDRGRAVLEFRQANALCRRDHDDECAHESRQILEEGHR